MTIIIFSVIISSSHVHLTWFTAFPYFSFDSTSLLSTQSLQIASLAKKGFFLLASLAASRGDRADGPADTRRGFIMLFFFAALFPRATVLRHIKLRNLKSTIRGCGSYVPITVTSSVMIAH